MSQYYPQTPPTPTGKGAGVFPCLLLSVVGRGLPGGGERVFWSLASTNKTTYMLWRKPSGKEICILVTEHTEDYSSSKVCAKPVSSVPHLWSSYLSCLDWKEYGLWVLIYIDLWDFVGCLSIWVCLGFYHN